MSDLRYCDRSAGTDGGRVPRADHILDDREAITAPRLDASLIIQERVFCATRVARWLGDAVGATRARFSSPITDFLHLSPSAVLAQISPGYNVVVANSAEQALAVVQSGETSFDAVISVSRLQPDRGRDLFTQHFRREVKQGLYALRLFG